MKKTFLLISLAFLEGLLVSPSSGQEIKVEDSGLLEVQQSQNGWNSRERVFVKKNGVDKTPAAVDQRNRQSPLSSAGTFPADSHRRPDLPSVRATRAQGYVFSRGSSKTRRQAQSTDLNLTSNPKTKVTVTTTTGPLEIIRNGPTSSKGAGRTGPGAIRRPVGVSLDPAVAARSRVPIVKHTQNPKPSINQNSSASSYAASYGAYDPNAKKKRNY
jgi:hypothetical protein